MEAFTLTPVDVQEFRDMFAESQRIIREQAEKLANAKITWVKVSEAAEITRYDEKTLKLNKEEIGYRTRGRTIFFKLSDLNNWMESTYRSPKRRK